MRTQHILRYRGHLGLHTFAHILSDPRTRDIPLILETPAYDVPSSGSAAARERLATEGMSVWRTEVSVLNRVSGRLPTSEEVKSEDETELKESELTEFREEIANAVAEASKTRGAKGKKTDGASGGERKGKKGKGKRKRAEEEGEEDDDGAESCCESAH